jgi:hypothetical protein
VTVEVDIAGDAVRDVAIYDITPGLPPGGAALLRARPDTAVPFGDGDASIVMVRVRI